MLASDQALSHVWQNSSQERGNETKITLSQEWQKKGKMISSELQDKRSKWLDDGQEAEEVGGSPLSL